MDFDIKDRLNEKIIEYDNLMNEWQIKGMIKDRYATVVQVQNILEEMEDPIDQIAAVVTLLQTTFKIIDKITNVETLQAFLIKMNELTNVIQDKLISE